LIVSASFRTDIPAFHHRWFRERLAAGFCRVENPYGGPPSRLDLGPRAVDGFVFWTRDASSFLPALEETAALGIPFIVQHTLTGLPDFLEPAGGTERAVEAMRAIARRFGPRAVVWRYDPIVHTSVTDDAFHLDTFTRLARSLNGAVDEVVVSFLHPYKKTIRGMNAACDREGVSWRVPDIAEKRALTARLAERAADFGTRLSTCAQPDLTGVPGTGAAACVDAGRLSDLAGRPIKAKLKGNRKGCGCAESRDIGAYDSCPRGCVYCYAVDDPARVRGRLRDRNPMGEFLIAPERGGEGLR